MLNAYTAKSGDTKAQSAKPFWVDILNPTSDEIAQVAAEYGIEVPSRESMQEIETSSRLRAEGQVLYVSMPLAIQDEAAGFAPVPLGFILSPQLLVTVRYSEVLAFVRVETRVGMGLHVGSASVFCALIDGIVDFDADKLEKLSGSLAGVSAQAFGPQGTSRLGHKRISRA